MKLTPATVIIYFIIVTSILILYYYYFCATDNFDNMAAEFFKQQKMDATPKNAHKFNDKQEKGITKLVIYHMMGCGHCSAIMHVKQASGMTIYDELVKKFSNDKNVQILNFMHGRDDAANKFNRFPVIKLITETKTLEYNGDRSFEAMAKFVTENK